MGAVAAPPPPLPHSVGSVSNAEPAANMGDSSQARVAHMQQEATPVQLLQIHPPFNWLNIDV